MKVHVNPGCGNSPKQEFLKELTCHFAAYEIDRAMTCMHEEVRWTLVGDEPIVGRDAFAAALESMSGTKVSELTIHGIVTHGREAAVHGIMHMADGKRFGFSDFYEFTSAGSRTVREITTYVIEVRG